MSEELEEEVKKDVFIDELVKQEKVWALSSNAGFATSVSGEFENAEGEAIPVVCFWSGKKKAILCKKKHWKKFVPKEISLVDFLEQWCVGMHNDHLIAGTNFDIHLKGRERQPAQLILDIAAALQQENKSLSLKKFDQMEDILTQVSTILKEEEGGEEEGGEA